jgi:hypothetical protein
MLCIRVILYSYGGLEKGKLSHMKFWAAGGVGGPSQVANRRSRASHWILQFSFFHFVKSNFALRTPDMKFRARNFLFGRPSILLLNLVLNLVFFICDVPFQI